jgi:hypothetical protein
MRSTAGLKARSQALGLAGIAVALGAIPDAIPAFAHHSFAMFDAAQKTELKGTVKQFQWTNPHSWLLLMVADDEGRLDQWAIELVGPSGLARRGWVPKTLAPGMDVTVTIHPLRDGTHGGQFMTVTFPDGTQLGTDVENGGGAERANP